MVLFGLPFLLGGLFVVFFFTVRPIYRMIDASSWAETPCTVISSEVESHHSSDGTTYSIEITYEYEFNGQTYTSDRYDFIGGSSSGHAGKQRVVDQYPPGEERTCFVDPDDPATAVLHRGWSWLILIGLFGLIFVLVGGAVIWWGLFGRGKDIRAATRARHIDWLPTVEHPMRGGRIELKPSTSRMVRVIGLFIVTAFWNGIVSVFVTQAVQSHLSGSPQWFPTLFMIPFVLIGLGLIGAFIYQVLALFNPKIVLSIDTATLKPGGVADLTWRIDGAVRRLRGITIEMIGEESATYRRGTDTVTDTHTFATHALFETASGSIGVSPTGSAEITVPDDAMHSFESGNNTIAWKLRVRGDVPRWPDVRDDYTLVIEPHGVEDDHG